MRDIRLARLAHLPVRTASRQHPRTAFVLRQQLHQIYQGTLAALSSMHAGAGNAAAAAATAHLRMSEQSVAVATTSCCCAPVLRVLQPRTPLLRARAGT